VSVENGNSARHDLLRLPADSDFEGVFRQYVRLAIHRAHRDDLLDRVLLVTDELVSNSIRHSGNDGQRFVELSLVPTQRGVHVEVSDGDPTPPVVRTPVLEDTEGRGLQVVDSIASAWGCEPAESGKTIWADVDPD
jgi:anti-sigma regulatory factor (Ser/Thr protein kinase)